MIRSCGVNQDAPPFLRILLKIRHARKGKHLGSYGSVGQIKFNKQVLSWINKSLPSAARI